MLVIGTLFPDKLYIYPGISIDESKDVPAISEEELRQAYKGTKNGVAPGPNAIGRKSVV